MSREYFEAIAGQWDELRQGFFSTDVREKALDAVCPRAGAVAADIGAGTGFITEGLVRRGLRVIAVDQSDAMLAQMRQRFQGSEEITYVVVDGHSLPLPDATVDYVFANMYLHHVDAPARAIEEMVRILKPGGRLVMTDLDRHTSAFLLVEHHDRWPGFERSSVRRWFEESGLARVRVTSLQETCACTSASGSDLARVGIFLATGERVGAEHHDR
jgi:ubiquinone/menaquinone biosynthesis C-methylase UbiE